MIRTFAIRNMLETGIPLLLGFLAPIGPLVAGVGFFALADTFTGIWAAKKRGEKIHSRAMGRTVTKLLLYSLFILLSYILEIVFMPWSNASAIAAGYVAIMEFKSNTENIGYVTGIDLWTYIQDKIDVFKPKKETNSE